MYYNDLLPLFKYYSATKQLMTSSRKVSNEILAITIAGILLTTTSFTMSSNSQTIFAQQPPPQPAQPQLQPQQQQQQQNAPLNFYLKLADNASAAQTASQATAGGAGTKNMTVTVNVQKGPGGQQIALPISAMVPANVQPQDLQLCASLADGAESCQPLSGGQQAASIDLTQPAAAAGGTTPPPMGTASPMPSPVPAPPTGTVSPMPAPAPQSYPNTGGGIRANDAINPIVEAITSAFTVQYAEAQLISIEDTTVNIPVTVIVPIDLNIQNAQVCASVLSSGSQTCNQVVLNPEQTSYTNVDVDLSTATPTLTTAQQEPTTALTTTTAEPTTTATTQPLATPEPSPTAPTTTTEEPTAPTTTEEPTAETGTQEGGTTAQEPTTEGSPSDGGSQ
jgi:hypothetical protein